MSESLNRRGFLKGSLLAGAAGALGAASAASAAGAEAKPAPAGQAAPPAPAAKPPAGEPLPCGKIGKLQISRMLLGGNLLTHYCHSRDLKYVYNLTAHYNTDAKVRDTLALAEQHGINTVSMHNPPAPMEVLRQHRKAGGKIQWIICPISPVDGDLKAYAEECRKLVQDDGCEALYVWGVRSDPLIKQGKTDVLAKLVEIGKDLGVPSGVGCHDLAVVEACEKEKIPCDFYIKTFHHHKYPSGPKPEQIKGPYAENPGYWCADPDRTIEVMAKVEKPWIAFKIMAAGAIPPANAFPYVINNGADHALVGMFDFEIADDAALMRKTLAEAKRTRPWRS